MFQFENLDETASLAEWQILCFEKLFDAMEAEAGSDSIKTINSKAN